MKYVSRRGQGPDPHKRFRHWVATVSTLALAAAQATPASAFIDNTATANGIAPDASAVTDDSLLVRVPVAPRAAALTVGKSVAAPVDTVADGVIKGGDTIAYTFTVWNRGNTTMYNVVPVDSVHTFNGVAADNAMGAFTPASITLAPGASQAFTATYTLSDLDAFRAAGVLNGVSNTMSATGNMGSSGGPAIPPANVTTETITPGQSATATTTVPANPRVVVSKSGSITAKGPGNLSADAEVGDTITYTYTVNNEGNVPLTGVSITDEHEVLEPGYVQVAAPTIQGEAPGTPIGSLFGASSDALANDGVWSSLVANDQVTFTYVHTVGQDEFDSQ